MALMLREQKATVSLGELGSALGISPEKEKRLLAGLARRGLITRVRRGLYLVPPEIPLGGRWTPSEALALSTLMADADGRYQISGPNAFSRYGWDTQIPNRVYVYNNRLSGERTIGVNRFTLILVDDTRLGGTVSVKAADNSTLVYASRARALVDAVYDWSRFNSLPRAFGWIQTEIKTDEGMAAKLVDASMQFGNQGTMRRIGYLLERLGVPDALLKKLQRKLRPTTGLIPWNPVRPKRGKVSNRWMLVVNDE